MGLINGVPSLVTSDADIVVQKWCCRGQEKSTIKVYHAVIRKDWKLLKLSQNDLFAHFWWHSGCNKANNNGIVASKYQIDKNNLYQNIDCVE